MSARSRAFPWWSPRRVGGIPSNSRLVMTALDKALEPGDEIRCEIAPSQLDPVTEGAIRHVFGSAEPVLTSEGWVFALGRAGFWR